MHSYPQLLMVLHTRTLPEAILLDREVVGTFLKCAVMRESLVLATPADEETATLVSGQEGIHMITYESLDEAFSARYRTNQSEIDVDCGPDIHVRAPGMLTRLYGFREESPELDEISWSFRDLLAFESIASDDDQAIFVTQDQRLIDKRIWIQSRFQVKILSILQALEYFDLFLKKHNLYYANPRIRRVDGKAFHYWFLLKELCPHFADAWSIATFGREIIENGDAIQTSLSSLADRFQNMLCASDRIAMEYTKSPINSTEWEMVYNFNYFVLLTTGLFDSLGWLTLHRYQQNVRRPFEVDIRTNTARGRRFVNRLAEWNSSLSSFIRSQQDLICLFYPMRDSVQHRDPLGGAHFVYASDGWKVSVVQPKLDALNAIIRVDTTGHPFTEWGVLSEGRHLEPHRFCRKASRELLRFTDRYLELLDMPSLTISHPEVQTSVGRARSQAPEPPFIAKTYLSRDSHLPILFRSRRYS